MGLNKWLLLGGGLAIAYYLNKKASGINGPHGGTVTGLTGILDLSSGGSSGSTKSTATPTGNGTGTELMPIVTNNNPTKVKSELVKSNSSSSAVNYPQTNDYGSLNNISSQPIGSSSGSYLSYSINGTQVTQAYYNAYKAANGLV